MGNEPTPVQGPTSTGPQATVTGAAGPQGATGPAAVPQPPARSGEQDGEVTTADRSNIQPGVDLASGKVDPEPGHEAVAEQVEKIAARYEEHGDPDAADKVREQLAPRTD